MCRCVAYATISRTSCPVGAAGYSRGAARYRSASGASPVLSHRATGTDNPRLRRSITSPGTSPRAASFNIALVVSPRTTQAILTEAARGLVPGDVIDRRKRGLSVPVARWLNTGLASLADRYLRAPRLYPDAPLARLLA